MPHREVTSCIHQVPIFRALPADSVKRLQGAMQHGHFMPGQQIIRMGDPVECLVVVASGLLKLSRTSKSGREQIIRELGPGQFYGEMALFTPVASEGDLIAVQETHACLLDRSAVQTELQSQPGLAVPLVEAIAQRLAEAERAIGDLALLDVGERLAAELLRLGEAGEHTAEGIVFNLPVTWAQLANRLGTTPESLSRRLKAMTEAGHVHVQGRSVLIRDPAALRSMVEGM